MAKPSLLQVENLIDKSSVRDLIEAIAAVCAEKADWIEESWQDRQTAKVWRATGAKLFRSAEGIEV